MSVPNLTQFRVEHQTNGLVHLVFDCPGRTMNVFSNAAIHELGAFAEWLANADVNGVLIRSGKDNAFCAGADLTELGVAYDMIMEAPKRARFNVAFDHFFPLSKAIRALETAGKPVAAAIGGLALGGGCELALGAHYRVLADDPKVGMGLPESLVGLLPGAGGTQRLPRLVGVDVALPILMDGGRLSGSAALSAGLVHELAPVGEEIARAEAWLLSAPNPCQPWDHPDWQSPPVTPMLAERRATADTYNPALSAILDCVQFGLPQTFEGAIRSEMAIFAHLIQRPEPRNMIQTLFLGKTDYDRLARKDILPSFVTEVVEAVKGVAGDRKDSAVLQAISEAVVPLQSGHSREELRIADYAAVKDAAYPAYLGGPFTFAVRGFD
jgi:3-hydroxyacyl-CoA dehydrogenase / enoyl-CoA hydratase / 3-hydroxybutyryl-CoA epimerase